MNRLKSPKTSFQNDQTMGGLAWPPQANHPTKTLPSLLRARVAPAAVPHFHFSPPSPMASPPSQAPSGIPAAGSPAAGTAAPASFVKLAMRNMVRKGRQSLVHFGLTALGFTVFIVFVAWLGRPHLPQ